MSLNETNARTGRHALGTPLALLLGAAALLALGAAGHAQDYTKQGGGLGGTHMTDPPSGSTGLTKGPGSGMTSQPPGTGIGGNNPGSTGSTGMQGTSGGNLESGGGKGMAGPTGSGSPGTGPGANPPRLGQ